MRLRHRIVAVGVAGVVLTPAMAGTALATPGGGVGTRQAGAGLAPVGDRTSALEKRRVDSVPTPKLRWYKCYDTAECASVRLPLDYDQPKGATTELALLRVKARDPKKRIGSLFITGIDPGDTNTDIPYRAKRVFGPEMLDRFDIVGFDPRGIGASDNVRCFKSVKDQVTALTGWRGVYLPMGKKEEAAFIKSAKAIGRGCSTTGRSLAGAMSTAETARDMDVLRRAVGDKKLSYLGLGYGTVLGQYYANMFPDRVRALALDGVINPVSWVGTSKTANQTLYDRMRSADGMEKALHEILVRCGQAGPKLCSFAEYGDPVKNFDVITARLKAKPATNGWTYGSLVWDLLSALYIPGGYRFVDAYLTDLWLTTSPATAVPAARIAKAKKALADLIAARRAQVKRDKAAAQKMSRRDFTYYNYDEAYSGVICTDGLHPKSADSWPKLTAASDKRAPNFGRVWGWSSVQCAGGSWTVRDEDAYTGPFNRRTGAPVLLVGNYYDPATNYDQAVSSSKLLQGSRLLSSDSWGHTAYGSSACVNSAVEGYLLNGALPAAGALCVGDLQPFTPEPASARKTRGLADTPAMTGFADTTGNAKQLPPVAVRVPPSTLLGTR